MTAREFITTYRMAPPEVRLTLLRQVSFQPQPARPLSSADTEDANADFRAEVTKNLYQDFLLADLELVRALYDAELACERQTWQHESLYQLAYYLFALGQLADVFRLYQGKYGTGHMDPSVMMDREMLSVGHEIAEVQRYVEQRFAEDPELQAQHPQLLPKLQELQDDPTYSGPAAYAQILADYFLDSDDEPEPQPNPNSGYMERPLRPAQRPWWKFW